MDSLYFVAESPIHGKGLFARVDIPAGTYLGDYLGPVVVEDGTYVLWIHDEATDTEFGIDGVNELRYMNHAAEPVAELDGQSLYALAPIRAGSEITIHYGADWDDLPEAVAVDAA